MLSIPTHPRKSKPHHALFLPQPSTVSLPTSQKSMMPAACTTFWRGTSKAFAFLPMVRLRYQIGSNPTNPWRKRPGCVLYRHLNRNAGQWSTSQTVKDKNHLHDSSPLDFIWGPPTNLHIPSKCANTKHLQHLLGLARVCHIARPGVHRWTVWSTCQGIKGLLQGGITRSHTTTAWN